MSGPLVTAIVPTFRRPHLLERSVESILRQAYRPLEVIVVDDESGDDTPKVLASFASRARELGIQYSWFTKPNGGPGLARNEAMRRGKGGYFAFLDDDDEWKPEKTALQVAAFAKQPDAGACFGRLVHAGKEDKPKPPLEEMQTGWVFSSLCAGKTRAYVVTLMVSRRMFEDTGGFGPHFNWEDTEFELRLSLHAPFICVPEVVTVVHTEAASVSREAGLEGDLKRDRLKLDLLDSIIAKNGNHPKFDLPATKILRARVFDEHIKHLVWLGRVADARAAWREGIAACGDHEVFRRLRRKLLRARVAGWFGRKLGKP